MYAYMRMHGCLYVYMNVYCMCIRVYVYVYSVCVYVIYVCVYVNRSVHVFLELSKFLNLGNSGGGEGGSAVISCMATYI